MKWIVAAAALLLGLPTVAAAQDKGVPLITRCDSVPKVKVPTTKDVGRLLADIKCLKLVGPIADAAIAAREARIAELSLTKPVAAPSLSGIAAVASKVDVPSLLQPAWGTGAIPGPENGEGAFRFICSPSHLSYDDPVIYPGQPGKSHLHTFFGNTKADAFSTYTSLRTTGDSTCNNLLNRSAYWIPSLMNGRGKVVMPDYVAIYYKGLPASDPICKQLGKACVPIPRGLRYVFGYNMQNPDQSAPATTMWWHCDADNMGNAPNIPAAAKGCPTGARIGMVLTGPNCWNGRDLDSPDHRSHMAYTYYDNGVSHCPATHPYVIPHFTIGAWYTTDETLPDWYLSSDRMPGMPDAVPGSTMHSDWFGAWEDSVLATWQANCIDKMLSCSGGDLGDGTQLKNLPQPDRPRLVDVPVRPN